MIPVRKYDPKVFRMLIEFTHSGVVTLNAETVPGNRLTNVHVYMYSVSEQKFNFMLIHIDIIIFTCHLRAIIDRFP